MVINCYTLLTIEKHTQFMSTMEAEDIDIVIGTESHIDASVSDGEIFHPGYDIHKKDQNRNSGLPEFDSNCEAVWAKEQVCGCRTLIVGSYYRPPNTSIHELTDLKNSLGMISSKYPAANIVLGGDFNIPSIDWETKSVNRNPQYGHCLNHKLIDICQYFSLDQMVRMPTCLNNKLDLILTRNHNLFRNTSTVTGISDHDIVTTDLDMKVPMKKKKQDCLHI